jgi:hypothetical protein
MNALLANVKQLWLKRKRAGKIVEKICCCQSRTHYTEIWPGADEVVRDIEPQKRLEGARRIDFCEKISANVTLRLKRKIQFERRKHVVDKPKSGRTHSQESC